MATHTTRTTVHNPGSRLLRLALRGDGIFECITGLALIVGAGPISQFLGLNAPTTFIILFVLGIVLLLSAFALFWIAAQEPINQGAALAYSAVNGVWAIGSLITLLAGCLPFGVDGKWAMALLAAIVALFAELQVQGVWRLR